MKTAIILWQAFLHGVFGIKPAWYPTCKTIYRWYSPIPGVPPFWVIVGSRYSDGREERLPPMKGNYIGWRGLD